MSKLNIDEILLQQASQLHVSTPIVESINPWEKPINRICFGMVFTTITLQFLYLDLILQTIGYCFLFLGFYALKNQNILFKLGFYLTILNIIYYFYSLAVYSTSLEEISLTQNSVLQIIKFSSIPFILHFALKMEFKKIGKNMPTNLLLGLTLFFIVISIILNSVPDFPLFFLLIMIVIYIIVIFSFSYITYCMTEIGYRMKNSKNYISHRWVKMIFYSFTIVWLLGLNLLQTHKVESFTLEEKTVELPSEWVEKGFPEKHLNDVPELQKLSLTSINRIKVDHSTNEDLELSIVQMKLENGDVYLLNYFNGENIYWTDVIELQDSYTRIYPDTKKEVVGARMLYDKDNETYIAPMDVEERLLYDTPSLYAKINYPFHSTNQRGYILVKYDNSHNSEERQMLVESILNYYHSEGMWQLPYEESTNRSRSNKIQLVTIIE